MSLDIFPTDSFNPLDVLEELVSANDWPFERTSESELLMQIEGRWCGYRMCFVWQADLSAVFFSCHFEARISADKRRQVRELLGAVNERLWLGHFELASETAMPLFRHTLPLRGSPGASVEQLEDLVDTAAEECERLYPALQLVVWGGQSVESALSSALMETVGEA